MRSLAAALAVAILLVAAPAEAAKRKPVPSPSASTAATLSIQGVSVDVQPMQAAPGMPAAAPDGAHIEQPPLQRLFRALPLAGQGQGSTRGFKARPRKGASPAPSPASP